MGNEIVRISMLPSYAFQNPSLLAGSFAFGESRQTATEYTMRQQQQAMGQSYEQQRMGALGAFAQGLGRANQQSSLLSGLGQAQCGAMAQLASYNHVERDGKFIKPKIRFDSQYKYPKKKMIDKSEILCAV